MFLLSQCHTLVNCGSSESGESGCLKFHQLWIFVTEKKMSYPNLDNEKKRAGKNHTHQRGQALGIAIVIGSQHRQSLSVCAYVDPVAAENRIANCWCCFFFFFFINQIELQCSQLALNLVLNQALNARILGLASRIYCFIFFPKKFTRLSSPSRRNQSSRSHQGKLQISSKVRGGSSNSSDKPLSRSPLPQSNRPPGILPRGIYARCVFGSYSTGLGIRLVRMYCLGKSEVKIK